MFVLQIGMDDYLHACEELKTSELDETIKDLIADIISVTDVTFDLQNTVCGYVYQYSATPLEEVTKEKLQRIIDTMQCYVPIWAAGLIDDETGLPLEDDEEFY